MQLKQVVISASIAMHFMELAKIPKIRNSSSPLSNSFIWA